MNVVAGATSPEISWAPKLAWYMSSLSRRNSSSIRARWPNVLTRVKPL